jgi:hypothetical protein
VITSTLPRRSLITSSDSTGLTLYSLSFPAKHWHRPAPTPSTQAAQSAASEPPRPIINTRHSRARLSISFDHSVRLLIGFDHMIRTIRAGKWSEPIRRRKSGQK